MIGYLSPLIFLYDIGYYNDTGHEQVKFIYHNLILFEIKLSFLVHPDKNRDDSDRAQKAFEGILYCSVVSWKKAPFIDYQIHHFEFYQKALI